MEAKLEDILETEPEQWRRGGLERSLMGVLPKESDRMKDAAEMPGKTESRNAIASLDFQIYGVLQYC